MGRAFPSRAVWNVLLAGFALRWLGLEAHSLWFDEGVTWAWATKPTLGETVFAEPNHPPVWWLITRGFVALFGDAEEVLRAPAALCGVVAVYLAWRLGLRLLSPAHAPRRGGFVRPDDEGAGARQAAWFAGFVAGGAFFLEVSQEARMYALLLAESLGLTLLYLRWLDRDDRASLVGYAALAALALHTHYFALWPLAALAVHALWLSRRTRHDPEPSLRVRLAPFALANLAAALLFVPWLVFLLRHYEGLALNPEPAPFWHLLYVLRRVGVGPAVTLDPPWTWITDLLWIPALALGIRGLRGARGARPLVLSMLFVPLAGLLALLVRWPFLHERYLVFLAPWLWLLAVIGAFSVRSVLRAALLAGLCTLTALGLVGYHLGTDGLVPVGDGASLAGRTLAREMGPDPDDPTTFLHQGHPFAKEPWRDAHLFVAHYGSDDDLVVLHPGSLRPVWDYYDRSRRGGPMTVLALPDGPLDAAGLRQRFGSLFASHRRIFLICSHVPEAAASAAFTALSGAVTATWAAAESLAPDVVPPIPFRLSNGLSVSVLSRAR